VNRQTGRPRGRQGREHALRSKATVIGTALSVTESTIAWH